MAQKLRKILSRLLIILFALVLIVGVIGFVLIRQSFPKIDGSVLISGLDGEVEIIRDSFGVPHIYASTLNDLFMAQGYVMPRSVSFKWISLVTSVARGYRRCLEAVRLTQIYSYGHLGGSGLRKKNTL